MIKNLQPRLAEAGKIKIGGLGDERQSRVGGTYRLPIKYDHFVITTTQRDEQGGLIEDHAIMAELRRQGYQDDDGQIRKIPIFLHDDEIDLVFPTAYTLYSGKSLACRGDGESAIRHEIIEGQRTGRTKEIECPCSLLEERRCKSHGVLHCSIRLEGLAVAGAVYRWRTTSLISVSQMVGSLQQILGTIGVLRGLPLILCVTPIRVTPDGKPTTVYICHVELHAADIKAAQNLALEIIQQTRQIRFDLKPELPSPTIIRPGEEPDDEQAEIADEYYPDEILDEQPPIPREEPVAPVSKPAPVEAEPGIGDPPGGGRRTRCLGCGGLFYPANLVKRKCSDCRPAIAEPPSKPSVPEDQPVKHLCASCGKIQVDGIGECCVMCSAPPIPQAPTDGLTAHRRFTTRIKEDISAGHYTANSATQAIQERLPDLPIQPAKWTDGDADKAIAVLDELRGQK